MKTLRLLVPLVLLFAGCDLVGHGDGDAPASAGVLVVNQGNFTDRNGSITRYDLVPGRAAEAVAPYETLLQSLTLHGAKAYVASNTADAVDVFDVETMERTGQVAGVAGPRYLAVAEGGRAFVSNLFENTVTMLDLDAGTVLGTAPVGLNPEDVAVVGARVYVANSGFGASTTLTVLDAATGDVTGTVDLGCDGPRHLEADGDGDLWAVCNGATVYDDDWNVVGMTDGAVVVLDAATGSVEQRFDVEGPLGAASFGQDSYYAPEARELFVVQGTDVLVFDTGRNARGETITLAGEAPVGGVAYDGAAGRLYAARQRGFDAAGFVSIHDRTGAEVGRFDAGVAPTQVVLYRLP